MNCGFQILRHKKNRIKTKIEINLTKSLVVKMLIQTSEL